MAVHVLSAWIRVHFKTYVRQRPYRRNTNFGVDELRSGGYLINAQARYCVHREAELLRLALRRAPGGMSLESVDQVERCHIRPAT